MPKLTPYRHSVSLEPDKCKGCTNCLKRCPVEAIRIRILCDVAARDLDVANAGRARAERELRDVFGVKVALELWVKVEPNWMKNERLLAEMGYMGGEI